jgi:integrase
MPFIREIIVPSEKVLRTGWKRTMKSLGMNHTPHDCRHTFSWLCDTHHVDTISKHMIMGHTLGNDVEAKVYSHRTMEQLREEIEKIIVT